MNKKSIFLSVLMIAFITVVAGCYYDKEELLYPNNVDCATVSAKYSTDIAPLMQNKCATSGCHDAAGARAGVVLETYTQVSSSAAAINNACIVNRTMPPSGGLTVTETSALKCWISSGAPNN
jgi:uncharacterized membrane protein